MQRNLGNMHDTKRDGLLSCFVRIRGPRDSPHIPGSFFLTLPCLLIELGGHSDPQPCHVMQLNYRRNK